MKVCSDCGMPRRGKGDNEGDEGLCQCPPDEYGDLPDMDELTVFSDDGYEEDEDSDFSGNAFDEDDEEDGDDDDDFDLADFDDIDDIDDDEEDDLS
jgi:hypothetical protein